MLHMAIMRPYRPQHEIISGGPEPAVS